MGIALAYHVVIAIFHVNTATQAQDPSMTHPKPMRIALLAYDGCLGTEIFGISDVLRMASHIARALHGKPVAPFELQVIGLGKRTVLVAGGIAVGVQRPSGRYDLLIVPGLEISRLDEWSGKLAPLGRELAFIRKTFASGVAVASVCVGTFLLGEAGLLAGRQVTTAWLCAAELASRYPAARVNADAVLVEDGAVTTTGAVSSVFDLAIHLVKKILGADVASATARVALLQGPRTSQAPFVDTALLAAPARPNFSHNVAQWLEARLAQTYDLERLAQAFHVSPRTLLRRVKAETGQTPLALLQQARVEKAKHLLGSTAWSLARITEEVGYADVATFSRLFAKRVGESPARYRRR